MKLAPLAATALVACSHAAAPQPPPATGRVPQDATELLKWTAQAYAGAKTYRDHGRVAETLKLAGANPDRSDITFDTAYDRASGGFRLTYRSARGSNALWTEGKRVYASLDYKPGIDEAATLYGGLGALAGLSHNLTRIVPPLLIGDDSGMSLAQPTGAELVGRETVAGRSVWHVRSVIPTGIEELWVDATTFAIVSLRDEKHVAADDKRHTPAFDVLSVIDFTPELDPPLAVAELAGPPGDRPVHESKPWVGVLIDQKSLRINQVMPDAPADKAGMKAGDELVALDGVALATSSDLPTRVRQGKIGDKVVIRVRRDGAELDLTMVLEEKKDIEQIRGEALLNKKAPALDAAKISGAYSTKLDELAGHVVVVDFWATWCGPCRSTFPRLNALHDKYKELRIIGVSNEDADEIRQFVAQEKLAYTIAHDADASAWRSYFVSAIPQLVVIDKTGVIRDVEIGAGDFDALEQKLVELMKR